jgi:hypothetical protein
MCADSILAAMRRASLFNKFTAPRCARCARSYHLSIIDRANRSVRRRSCLNSAHLLRPICLNRTEGCFNICTYSLQRRARIWNSTSHCIEVVDHMLMADVAYLNASAFERIGICFPLFAQYVETCGVDMGGRPERLGPATARHVGSIASCTAWAAIHAVAAQASSTAAGNGCSGASR